MDALRGAPAAIRPHYWGPPISCPCDGPEIQRKCARHASNAACCLYEKFAPPPLFAARAGPACASAPLAECPAADLQQRPEALAQRLEPVAVTAVEQLRRGADRVPELAV